MHKFLFLPLICVRLLCGCVQLPLGVPYHPCALGKQPSAQYPCEPGITAVGVGPDGTLASLMGERVLVCAPLSVRFGSTWGYQCGYTDSVVRPHLHTESVPVTALSCNCHCSAHSRAASYGAQTSAQVGWQIDVCAGKLTHVWGSSTSAPSIHGTSRIVFVHDSGDDVLLFGCPPTLSKFPHFSSMIDAYQVIQLLLFLPLPYAFLPLPCALPCSLSLWAQHRPCLSLRPTQRYQYRGNR